MSLLLLLACADRADPIFDGVAVAVQDRSAIVLLDLDGAVLDEVDLTDGHDVPMVHNVQITPDRTLVLATTMPAMDAEAEGHAMRDQLLVVAPGSGRVKARCDLGEGLGAAHVVTDGTFAWVTAYDGDAVLEVEYDRCKERRRWPLPPGTGPHGLRRGVDGSTLWVAGMDDGSLHRVDLVADTVERWDLPAGAVQVAVLPDGSAVLATVRETVQVARLDLADEALTLFDLPAGATGPAQLYPAPDSASVWVADEGTVDGVLAGRELFRLDARTGELQARVLVDEAPHGVVVSPDGETVWATSLGADTVDRIDAGSGALLGSTRLDGGPYGISLSTDGTAMP